MTQPGGYSKKSSGLKLRIVSQFMSQKLVSYPMKYPVDPNARPEIESHLLQALEFLRRVDGLLALGALFVVHLARNFGLGRSGGDHVIIQRGQDEVDVVTINPGGFDLNLFLASSHLPVCQYSVL